MTWTALEMIFNVYMAGTSLAFLSGLLAVWLAWVGALTALPENERRVIKYSARVVMFCWAWPLIVTALVLVGLWRLVDFLVEHAELEELWNRGTK